MLMDAPPTFDAFRARPYLSVIIPCGGKRPEGLTRTLDSLVLQGSAAADLEILVVGDTLDGPLPHIEALVAARHDPRIRYLAAAGELHAWGQPQRQAGMEAARGYWLWWLADDDIATIGSISAIKAAIKAQPHRRPLLFQFMAPWRTKVWTPGMPKLFEGNIDASGIIAPNVPDKLGTWTNRYAGDYDFIALTATMWAHDVAWVDQVICWTRPTPGEDWTRHHRQAAAGAPVRLNIGAGDFPLPAADGWVNVDAIPTLAGADLCLDVTAHALPFADGEVAEVYAGHFLEHLTREQVPAFLAEVRRVLVPGGRFGVVVPDTREVMRRYVAGECTPVEWPEGHIRDMSDLDDICAMILFSTEQESRHQWAYDARTLRRTLERAGFTVTGAIDRHADPRLSTGQWYQCGADAITPVAAPAPVPAAVHAEAPRVLAEVGA